MDARYLPLCFVPVGARAFSSPVGGAVASAAVASIDVRPGYRSTVARTLPPADDGTEEDGVDAPAPPGIVVLANHLAAIGGRLRRKIECFGVGRTSRAVARATAAAAAPLAFGPIDTGGRTAAIVVVDRTCDLLSLATGGASSDDGFYSAAKTAAAGADADDDDADETLPPADVRVARDGRDDDVLAATTSHPHDARVLEWTNDALGSSVSSAAASAAAWLRECLAEERDVEDALPPATQKYPGPGPGAGGGDRTAAAADDVDALVDALSSRGARVATRHRGAIDIARVASAAARASAVRADRSERVRGFCRDAAREGAAAAASGAGSGAASAAVAKRLTRFLSNAVNESNDAALLSASDGARAALAGYVVAAEAAATERRLLARLRAASGPGGFQRGSTDRDYDHDRDRDREGGDDSDSDATRATASGAGASASPFAREDERAVRDALATFASRARTADAADAAWLGEDVVLRLARARESESESESESRADLPSGDGGGERGDAAAGCDAAADDDDDGWGDDDDWGDDDAWGDGGGGGDPDPKKNTPPTPTTTSASAVDAAAALRRDVRDRVDAFASAVARLALTRFRMRSAGSLLPPAASSDAHVPLLRDLASRVARGADGDQSGGAGGGGSISGDVHHAVSSLGGLLKTGLGRFGLGGVSKPKPSDHALVIFFVIGGCVLSHTGPHTTALAW